MSNIDKIQVSAEATPNPATMRFSISRQICDQSYEFNNSDEAIRSPLAAKLFGFPWTQAVYIGTNFVSITKQEWVDWKLLSQALCGLIQEHIENNEGIITNIAAESSGNDILDTDNDEVKQIKKILNKEIRPQVALDGGDIVFHSFEDGIVNVHMKGACSGCPSSSATLKMGIEVRLKQALPQIIEVRAV